MKPLFVASSPPLHKLYVILQEMKQQCETLEKHLDKKRKRSLDGTDSLSLEERDVLHGHYCKRIKLTCNKICEIVAQENARNSEGEEMLAV